MTKYFKKKLDQILSTETNSGKKLRSIAELVYEAAYEGSTIPASEVLSLAATAIELSQNLVEDKENYDSHDRLHSHIKHQIYAFNRMNARHQLEASQPWYKTVNDYIKSCPADKDLSLLLEIIRDSWNACNKILDGKTTKDEDLGFGILRDPETLWDYIPPNVSMQLEKMATFIEQYRGMEETNRNHPLRDCSSCLKSCEFYINYPENRKSEK